jgi:hypothetical protein
MRRSQVPHQTRSPFPNGSTGGAPFTTTGMLSTYRENGCATKGQGTKGNNNIGAK